MLSIEVLGGLSIQRDGERLPGLASRKAEALLVYLACAGRAQARDVLADLLWEERSQAQALTNLRKILAVLHQDLAPYLVISRQTVGINPSSVVWLDVVELDAGLRTASEQGQPTKYLPPTAAEALEHTLALYRGDFLAGFYVHNGPGFEMWLQTERERLRRQVIDALHHLVNGYLHSGQYSRGIQQATRLLQLDPLREEAHCQMMSLLAYTGQRREAMSQYETCRRLLVEELGVEPARVTTALYETIQAGTLRPGIAIQPEPVVVHSQPARVNLPQPLTPFIGRTGELAEITARLTDPDCRLLTLVGLGGVGKTRLALQAAGQQHNQFAHGVHFVSLASVNTADLLVFAMGGTLGISFRGPDTPPVQLLNYLQDKDLLLILDNFEHLLDGLSLLLDLLAGAPRLKLLVTSRQRLNVLGEWVLPIEGLEVPVDGASEQAEHASAVQLFVQSARRVQVSFSLSPQKADVLRICRLVEGLPLGLELAAVWVRLLPCARIADQLASSLDFLASALRDVPERQRSLRAVFDHTWRMLSHAEQAVMAKLSIFRGGFDLEAAAQVAGADLQILASLADKSLIRTDETGRCTVHELLRQFAADQLAESGESGATAHQHLRYFLDLAERVEADIYGPNQIAWFDRLETDHDNLRAALAWSLSSGEVETGLALATALGWFWQLRHHEQEGYEWSMRLLAANRNAPPAFWAKALHRAACLAFYTDKMAQGQALTEEALHLAHAADDKLNIAWSLATLFFTAEDIDVIGALEGALRLFRELDDAWGISHALRRLGLVMMDRSKGEQAIPFAEEALARARSAGDKSALAWSLYVLGRARYETADLTRAASLLQESLPLFRETRDDSGLRYAYLLSSKITFDQGDNALAHTLYVEALIRFQANNGWWERRGGTAACLVGLGVLAWRQNRPTQAARALGAAAALFEREPVARALFFDLDAQMAEVRARPDDPAFAAAWAEGQAMTLNQAAAYMLEKADDRT